MKTFNQVHTLIYKTKKTEIYSNSDNETLLSTKSKVTFKAIKTNEENEKEISLKRPQPHVFTTP